MQGTRCKVDDARCKVELRAHARGVQGEGGAFRRGGGAGTLHVAPTYALVACSKVGMGPVLFLVAIYE